MAKTAKREPRDPVRRLEATLKSAKIMDEKKRASVHVAIGNTVVLCDLSSNEEMRYTLVSTREVDLVSGKISSVSPIGQAVLGRSEGETCDVAAPVGRLRYKIKRVE